MITRVQIEQFRALKNVDVRLAPFTVLIGPNDTGKSSFLDAIFQELTGEDLAGKMIAGIPPPMQLAQLTGEIDGKKVARIGRSASNRGLLNVFRVPAAGVAVRSEGAVESHSELAPPLSWDGGNLAAVLDSFYRRAPDRFVAINDAMRRLVPGFDQIAIYTPSAAERALAVNMQDGKSLDGAALSAGVRLLLFFITLVRHPRPPALLMIEEPENGVHPKRMGEIVEMLRGLTDGTVRGRQVQVVLTTHSPYLVDHVKLPEDQVIVFRREADGSRSATEADQERLKPFLDEFMLGEVWFNQGEEGLIAKAR